MTIQPNTNSGPGHNGALTFPRDHHLRRKLGFTEASFQHKARANLYWLSWLLDRHTAADQTVLDPMGGAGTILLATLNQRPVLTGDIEPHWATLQKASSVRIHTQTLFKAPAYIHQWDAAKLPLSSGAVPAIVTSPPYFDLFSNWNRSHGTKMDGNPAHIGETGLCYGFHPAQIGNIHVYEEYLRTMREVYRECRRVLVPGGKLVLILGDKVRRGRIVPVTRDTETLCLANGFERIAHHERKTRPSHFRLIHAQKNGGDYPLIKVETALVFKKTERPPAYNFAIVEAPKPKSRPGQQLFEKQLTYAYTSTGLVLTLTKQGFYVGREPKAVWSGDHPRKARERREWAYDIIHTLVYRYGLGAGDKVELHVTDRYARYLQQRLITLGCRCSIPTARLNFGQKLAWYTQKLNEISSLDEARKGVSSGDQKGA